jgi:hypothetical protein
MATVKLDVQHADVLSCVVGLGRLSLLAGPYPHLDHVVPLGPCYNACYASANIGSASMWVP